MNKPKDYDSWSEARQKAYDYAKEREMQHIKASMRSDEEVKKEIQKLYENLSKDIETDINNWIMKYANTEGITIAKAKRRISTHDVKEHKEKVARYIDEKSLSEEARRLLHLQNVTSNVNRLEYLLLQIQLETIATADSEWRIIREYVITQAMEEAKRQAGIHDISLRSQKALRTSVEAVAGQSFKGAPFSERIWANQEQLRAALEQAVRRSVLLGKHPKTFATELMQYVKDESYKKKGSARFRAESILITETARTQTEIQKRLFEDGGFEQYIYIAEHDHRTCSVCASLDGEIFPVKDMLSGVNAAPMHTRCRCSTAAYFEID